jgi:hypothetical protein
MKQPKTWETFVQVRNGSLLTYDLPKEGFDCPSWRKPPTRQGYSGEVTESTRKRIATAIDIFLQISPVRTIHNPITNRSQRFQLSFITLTISQPEPVEASEGHKALKVFLQHFRRPWHKRKMSETMKTYVWKAEVQKRGQLHYHLTTNVFLHAIEIRRVWNDIQKKRGWLDSFQKAYGKWDANSTDVHSVKKIGDVGRYLTKYIAKQEYRQSPANPEAGFPALLEPVRLDAKVWGCSEDLKGVKRFSDRMDKWTWISMEAARMDGQAKLFEKERCKFYSFDGPVKTEDVLSTTVLANYNTWKQSI